MANKSRLDVFLFENKFIESREKAKAIIMSGSVFVDNCKVDKPGTLINIFSNIVIKDRKSRYVSRGGYKLEKLIFKHSIKLDDMICLDVGASTGGFTDCMLQNGAKKVYAVDVGYGQLDWKLRNDEKVVVLERTNARYLDNDNISDLINFSTMDVSFISVKLILKNIYELLDSSGRLLLLVKPQFEAGKVNVGKNGVVKDKKVHIDVIRDIYSYCKFIGFYVVDIDYSPIKGPKGNIEYLIYLSKLDQVPEYNIDQIDGLVFESHLQLNEVSDENINNN